MEANGISGLFEPSPNYRPSVTRRINGGKVAEDLRRLLNFLIEIVVQGSLSDR